MFGTSALSAVALVHHGMGDQEEGEHHVGQLSSLFEKWVWSQNN
jgi:hypothetical protein